MILLYFLNPLIIKILISIFALICIIILILLITLVYWSLSKILKEFIRIITNKQGSFFFNSYIATLNLYVKILYTKFKLLLLNLNLNLIIIKILLLLFKFKLKKEISLDVNFKENPINVIYPDKAWQHHYILNHPAIKGCMTPEVIPIVPIKFWEIILYTVAINIIAFYLYDNFVKLIHTSEYNESVSDLVL